jgi:hypothetical protein
MTLDLILKIFLTASLGYITLNTFLRFHFSIDRIYALFMGSILITAVIYLDTKLYFEIGLTIGIIFIVCALLKFISIKKKRHGTFLFNTYKKQYKELKSDITSLTEVLEIDNKNINYNQRKPWLVVIKDVELKKANELFKKLDNTYTHKPKKLTMYNYWFVIIFLTLMVILWRF